ncbi:MAG: enoyl-ACP reductase [Clostridia bacterium]|jgi:enoyl-[acyl-carrier protein] reductase I|nr:enoyl-ACP reductase [Clostridia bacterium]
MILEKKKILIMGIRNKWSIAWGTALRAVENGAELFFTYQGEENKEKIEALLSEIPYKKAYICDASKDEDIEKVLKEIKEEYGKLDGIVHCIAHANTEDLRNDFINTSKEGFAHANDVSAYSFVATARIARDIDILNENASLVSLTYYGSTKVLPGYNVMGVAKASLECSIRYLADNLGPQKVRVNAISAGPIKTLSAKGIKDFNSILDVVEEKAPLRKNVTQEEVGDAVAFMLSGMSRAITGQILYVDSGYNIMGL